MRTRLTLPLYLTATATSLFGNSAIGIVLPWLVLERTGDPAVAGMVAAASAVPGAVAAFVGGHLIDRIGRRRMSVIADLGSAASVAGLALVDAALGLDVVWFVALGILGALFDVPGMTARETLMADVAETSGVALDKVGALRGSLFGLSFLAGPSLAGWMLASMPSIHVVWLTAVCSAVAAAAIAIMPLRPCLAGKGNGSLLAGFNHIRRSAPLLALLVVNLGAMILVGPLLSIVLPAHFTALASPGLLGLALSAYAVGTMVGSGLYGWGFSGRRWLAWVSAQMLYVVSGVCIATLSGFWLVAAGMLAAGLGSGLLRPVATVVLTQQVPDAIRGRVFGAYSALTLVVTPVGLGAMAAVLTGADLTIVAWILAAGWVVVGAYAILAPGLRDYIDIDAGQGKESKHADDHTVG